MLAPWKKSWDKLSVLKGKDISLPTKIRIVKAIVFPAVMYRCESWTIKKGECWRIDTFELWCWRRLLRVPWTARRSNQSILKEITLNIHWKDWCWNWSASIWIIWWEQATHWKSPWCWERLRAETEGGLRRHCLDPGVWGSVGRIDGAGVPRLFLGRYQGRTMFMNFRQ